MTLEAFRRLKMLAYDILENKEPLLAIVQATQPPVLPRQYLILSLRDRAPTILYRYSILVPTGKNS